MTDTDSNWLEYWRETPDDPYLAAEAGVLVERLVDRLGLDGTETVLDYGCGYGYVSEGLAPHVASVSIWDHVAEARLAALQRIGNEKVIEFDPATSDSNSFDVIVVNSVIQYMSEETLTYSLNQWAGVLRPDGVIAITDVPSKPPSLMREGLAWFRLAFAHGVASDALRFARANADRYREARARAELATWDEARITELATRAGLVAQKEPENLAYQRGRDSYILRHT